MTFDFHRYTTAFNDTDEESFVREFYTEDVIVDGPQGVIQGAEQWVGALKFIHVSIEERLYPITVMQEGATIMAFMDSEFTAKADRPDFPFGPIKKGETAKLKVLARYELRDNRIAHLTLATWPTNAGNQ